MHRLVLVATIASACTRTQVRTAHRASEVATAGGLIGILVAATAASALPRHEDALLAAGAVFVPIAVLGALVYISTDRGTDAEARTPVLTRGERQRAAAWELTKQAASAARDQDCTQVQAIAPRVRDLDLDLHGSVFLRDVAIQRCLRR